MDRMQQHRGVLRKITALENCYNHALPLLFPRVIFSNTLSSWSAYKIMRQFGNKSLFRRLSGNRDFCGCGPIRAIPASSSELAHKSCPWDAAHYVQTEVGYWDRVCTPTFLVSSLMKKGMICVRSSRRCTERQISAQQTPSALPSTIFLPAPPHSYLLWQGRRRSGSSPRGCEGVSSWL